jgi:hypothetical protein
MNSELRRSDIVRMSKVYVASTRLSFYEDDALQICRAYGAA